jgi:RNA polymerase sigma factor (sigma-70 family)
LLSPGHWVSSAKLGVSAPTIPPANPSPRTHSGRAVGDPTPWFVSEVLPHHAQLKSYLRGAFPSVRDVDDLVQESYLRIWRTQTAHPIRSTKAFLFRIARHLALDTIRNRRRAPLQSLNDPAVLDVTADKPAPDDALGLQEKIEALSDAIAALPDRRREIIVLCKLHRHSQEEVARRLGVSVRTVENQLYRGIRQCEALLRRRGIHSFYGIEET